VRRRTNRADAVEVESGGLGNVISRHPREFVGIVLATVAMLAIFINALFLQKGPHPAPIFATTPLLVGPTPVNPVGLQTTRPNLPAAAPAKSLAELTADIQRELIRHGFYDGAADGIWGAKTDAGARDFVQTAGLKINLEASEGLLRALVASKAKAVTSATRNDAIAELIAPSKRVLAIQRALADFGYGQIKPTGVYDPETLAAVEKFERDHRLPVTGQISDRFVRELAAMTGRPLE